MRRVLCEITGIKASGATGGMLAELLGLRVISYPESPALAGLLRLSPEAKKLHYWSGYLNSEWVAVRELCDTDFDVFQTPEELAKV
jgi:hypothetical protein